ncbi:hypothetical protein EVJ20_07580 [Exiguobacterium sp. SH0S1]|uniref:Ig-like domain-containing protein n=1 Tax=Exiguobacterium sp. SH0S1 TaxID=2510949 RepID=UPI00103D7130|nr:Ig-like domain-containing protein [Exiguobacterium sp. SH0S1]TCI77813.1 hypothetical protein EVJ20_07580 [Exiguobacterium sp. SH0S1]
MKRTIPALGLTASLLVGTFVPATHVMATESAQTLSLSVSTPTTASKSLEITGAPNALAKIDFGFKVYDRKLDASGKATFAMNTQPLGKQIHVTLVSGTTTSERVTVTVGQDPSAAVAPKIATVYNTSRQIVFTGTPGATVKFSVNQGKFTGVYDSKGVYRFNMLPQRAGSVIRAVTVTSSGTSAETVSTILADKTAPAIPVVTSILKTTSTSVNGKTEPYATLVLTSGTNVYRAQADASGVFTVTFPRQPINRQLSLRAMDGAKNTSAVRTIVVQSALYENFYRIDTEAFGRLVLHKDTFNIYGAPRQALSVAPIFFGQPTKDRMAIEVNVSIEGNEFIEIGRLRFIVDGKTYWLPMTRDNVLYYDAEIADDDSANYEMVQMVPDARLLEALKAIRSSTKHVTVVVDGTNGYTTWFLSASERRAIKEALQYAGY